MFDFNYHDRVMGGKAMSETCNSKQDPRNAAYYLICESWKVLKFLFTWTSLIESVYSFRLLFFFFLITTWRIRDDGNLFCCLRRDVDGDGVRGPAFVYFMRDCYCLQFVGITEFWVNRCGSCASNCHTNFGRNYGVYLIHTHKTR